jgi:4-aminobutyrate aminotransferase
LSALRALAAAYPTVVRGVRGRGLLAGVQFDSGPTAVAVEQAAFTRGLLTLTAGDDVVRLTPPLVVSEPEIAIGVQLFGAAVKAVVELVRRGRLVSPLRGSFI